VDGAGHLVREFVMERAPSPPDELMDVLAILQCHAIRVDRSLEHGRSFTQDVRNGREQMIARIVSEEREHGLKVLCGNEGVGLEFYISVDLADHVESHQLVPDGAMVYVG